METLEGFQPRPKPEEWPEGQGGAGSHKPPSGSEETLPEQPEDHEGIHAGKESSWTFCLSNVRGAQLGENSEFCGRGFAAGADVLPGRARVDASQRRAGSISETRFAVMTAFQKLHESFP